MKVVNIKSMKAFQYKERSKNVFFSSEKLKLRTIELNPNGKMPLCQMESNVIFYVVEGETEVTVNDETKLLSEGECLISEPGRFSMLSKNGVRILGIQIL